MSEETTARRRNGGDEGAEPAEEARAWRGKKIVVVWGAKRVGGMEGAYDDVAGKWWHV